MARPKHCRCVGHLPRCERFIPADETKAEAIVLNLDEVEAIRLADMEGLYHAEAAERMEVSRPTFGRIISAARSKMANALIEGRGIVIEQGDAVMPAKRKFECVACGHTWEVPFGTGRPEECPECESKNLHRAFSEDDRGHHHGRGCHQGLGRHSRPNRGCGRGHHHHGGGK